MKTRHTVSGADEVKAGAFGMLVAFRPVIYSGDGPLPCPVPS